MRLGSGELLGVTFDVFDGVAHGEAEGGGVEHGDIVDIVADGDDARGVETEAGAEVLDAVPFTDPGCEYFENLTVIVGGVDGVAGDARAEGGGDGGGDIGGVVDVDYDAEADDEVAQQSGDIVGDFGMEAVGEEPFDGGAMGWAVISTEIERAIGDGIFDEDEDGVAA